MTAITPALGWLGTALVVGSYAQSDVRTLRVLSMFASIALVAFNVMLGIWSNVALEIALVTINVVRLARRTEVPPVAAELVDASA
jgi:hypothetical protein